MVNRVEAASAQSNVDTFLNMLSHVQRPTGDELVIRAWVRASTGQFQFTAPALTEAKNWQALEMRCTYDRQQGQVRFEKTEGDVAHLQARAAQVVAATFSAFAQLGTGLCRGGDLASQLDTLSKWAQPLSPIHEDAFIRTAFYEVHRGEAENLLQDRPGSPIPPGTYLFRKDHYAQVLENQLATRHRGVRCLTVTLAEKEGKFSDYTLVRCNQGWQIYNDDLRLEQPSFKDLQTLLSAHNQVFLYALYKTPLSSRNEVD